MESYEEFKKSIDNIFKNPTELKFDISKDLFYHNMKGIMETLSIINGTIFIYLNYNSDDISEIRHVSYLFSSTSFRSFAANIQDDLRYIKIGGSFNIIFESQFKDNEIKSLTDEIILYLSKD